MKFLLLIAFSFSTLFSEEISEKAENIAKEVVETSKDVAKKMVKAPKKAMGYTDYEEWHENSGYITLGLLGATMLTTWNEDIHKGFGIASAVGMAITTTLGVVAHKDTVFDLSDGWKKEHWHSFLGAFATVAIIMAVAEAPEDAHAGLGMVGGISAGISYAIVEW
jgi:hypothetical protein